MRCSALSTYKRLMPREGKGQSVKKTTVPNAKVLLAEAECGAEGVEVEAQPVPAHHDLVAVPAETRDTQAAVEVPGTIEPHRKTAFPPKSLQKTAMPFCWIANPSCKFRHDASALSFLRCLWMVLPTTTPFFWSS